MHGVSVSDICVIPIQPLRSNRHQHCSNRGYSFCNHLKSADYLKDTVQELLERGSNIEAEDDYQLTPLHYAVQQGGINIVKLLLEEGANIEAQDDEGRTSLHIAAERHHLGVVKELLDQGRLYFWTKFQ